VPACVDPQKLPRCLRDDEAQLYANVLALWLVLRSYSDRATFENLILLEHSNHLQLLSNIPLHYNAIIEAQIGLKIV
jgi:hypothetical protein